MTDRDRWMFNRDWRSTESVISDNVKKENYIDIHSDRRYDKLKIFLRAKAA